MNAEARTPILRPGELFNDRYRITCMLGEGAMGAVFEAQTLDGESVALKVLRDLSTSSESVARFVREVRILSAINSPHVVATLDGGMDPATCLPFLVMRHLQGEDLELCVRRNGPLDPRIAARIVSQACRGLKAAHLAGVIHRDIKPANLFLQRDDLAGISVKILDFGVAKALDSHEAITRSGSTLGTPLYMAPEQLLGARDIDARVDVWSTGITLFECLTGTTPFAEARNLAEIITAVMRADIPDVQDFAPWVPPGLASIVQGALIADPERRCPSIDAFATRLAAFRAGSELVTPKMLHPLPKSVKSHTEPRAPRVASWKEIDPPEAGNGATGTSLESLVDDLGPLSAEAASRVMADVGAAIAAAHDAGSCHGNLNPASILLEQASDGSLVVRVKDSDTDVLAVPGSVAFLAPEQIGEPPSTTVRTDVHALALCLHFGLTGRRPWAAKESVEDIIAALKAHDVEPISKVAPWVPSAVVSLTAAALSRNPEARPATVREFITALQAAAPPASRLHRSAIGAQAPAPTGVSPPLASAAAPAAGRWRRPIPFLLAMGLALALVAAVAVALR